VLPRQYTRDNEYAGAHFGLLGDVLYRKFDGVLRWPKTSLDVFFQLLAKEHCEVVVMPKGWFCDRGKCGSEGRVKPQRYVVNGLSCCLYVCVCVCSICNRCHPWPLPNFSFSPSADGPIRTTTAAVSAGNKLQLVL
jgi:hypothetical protein